MSQQLIFLGILVIFIGFIVVFIGALSGAQKGETKVAVGGFIGFIPFGYWSDPKLKWFVLGFIGLVMLFYIIWWTLR